MKIWEFWKRYVPSDQNVSHPAIGVDKNIYVTDNHAVISFDTSSFKNASINWSFSAENQNIRSTAAIGNGVVYFFDDSGILYAVGD